MASKAASKRLSKEYVAMQKEPPPFIWAAPDEKNILNWNFIIRGPPDSPYAGGEYHGMLMFPPEYPFKPPGIKMLTPSGRFIPDKKICFSMSDFHPGSWNPAWSVSTILTGLLSFMLSDEITTGSVAANDEQRKIYASRSHMWNIDQKRFKEAFPEYSNLSMKDLPNMAERERGVSSQSSPDSDPQPTSAGTADAAPSSTLSTQASASTAIAVADGKSKPSNMKLKSDPKAQVGWMQLVWDKWRWGLLIALAVVVSRLTSSK